MDKTLLTAVIINEECAVLGVLALCVKAQEKEIKLKIIFGFSVLKLYIFHQFCMCIKGKARGKNWIFVVLCSWRELSPVLGACSQPHHISRHLDK